MDARKKDVEIDGMTISMTGAELEVVVREDVCFD